MMRTGLTMITWALVIAGCSPDRDAARTREVDKSREPTVQPPAEGTISEWQIEPGRRAGPLTTESSEAALRQRYDSNEVESARIQLGEGETTPGTVLYPSDSLRRAEIVWQDTVQRARPARLILRGSRSHWRVRPGISLGTSLKELERLNGRSFKLAGFGWDYAGVVTDWNGGSLDTVLTGIRLYLDPGSGKRQSAAYSKVLGDRDYSSALAPMQELSPGIYQIFVDFE